MDGVVLSLPFPQAASKPTPKLGLEARFGDRRGAKFLRTCGVNSRLPDALFNDIDPASGVKQERPIHRQMTAMATQGYTIREIAAATGYNVGRVSNLLRQPHARQQMIEHAKKDVSLEIKNFLEGEVLTNLRVIRDIRDDPNVKPETRLAAADRLTDRHMGKPTQPFTLPAGGKDPSKMTDAELDAALRATGLDPARLPDATAATSAGSQEEATGPVQSA